MPDIGDEGMPYADEIRWHLSHENPNDFVAETRVPASLKTEDLLIATILELESELEHTRRSASWYRAIASAAFDSLAIQRGYIHTLHDLLNAAGRR